jgi:hypothetical protein
MFNSEGHTLPDCSYLQLVQSIFATNSEFGTQMTSLAKQPKPAGWQSAPQKARLAQLSPAHSV